MNAIMDAISEERNKNRAARLCTGGKRIASTERNLRLSGKIYKRFANEVWMLTKAKGVCHATIALRLRVALVKRETPLAVV